MTSTSRIPTPTSSSTLARPRRVKRGIVAGYIHDISPRHRGGATQTLKASSPSIPVPATAAVPVVELEPSQA
jgi:hypothetical protein